MNDPHLNAGRPSKPVDEQADIRIAQEKTTWLDRAVDRGSEWFSSILVKEARQALKSRQFIVTFFLLLLAVIALKLLYSAFF